jgi:hypothetical protein
VIAEAGSGSSPLLPVGRTGKTKTRPDTLAANDPGGFNVDRRGFNVDRRGFNVDRESSVKGTVKLMWTPIGKLFQRGRPPERTGELTLTSRPPSIAQTETGHAEPWRGLRLIEFEALSSRKHALLEGLAPVPEVAALTGFLGLGITKPNRYQNAAEAFTQLQLLKPHHSMALIQVSRQKLRDESKGHDSLYVHFAGDPFAHGLLICALSGGGLMTGWSPGR